MIKYWQVRIYNPHGDYGISQVSGEIDEVVRIKSFYEELTGCKMLIEAMQERKFNCAALSEVFYILYRKPRRNFENKSPKSENTP